MCFRDDCYWCSVSLKVVGLPHAAASSSACCPRLPLMLLGRLSLNCAGKRSRRLAVTGMEMGPESSCRVLVLVLLLGFMACECSHPSDEPSQPPSLGSCSGISYQLPW